VDNLTASYVHLHFDACIQVSRSLVEKAAAFRSHRPTGV
jgi:cobyrinic acid a,c-diamide synthase